MARRSVFIAQSPNKPGVRWRTRIPSRDFHWRPRSADTGPSRDETGQRGPQPARNSSPSERRMTQAYVCTSVQCSHPSAGGMSISAGPAVMFVCRPPPWHCGPIRGIFPGLVGRGTAGRWRSPRSVICVYEPFRPPTLHQMLPLTAIT